MGRYIDTEEFKHKINNSKWYGTDAWRDILDMAVDCDSVAPSRTKGEWRKSKTHASLWVCSVCDWGLLDCYDFNFCPECGADMRVDQDETNTEIPEYAKWKESYKAMIDCSWR